MPYEFDPLLNEDQQPQGQSEGQAQIAGGGPTVSGQQQAFGSATGAGPGQEKGSGRFQNLDAYVEANRGQEFGGKVADRLQTELDTAAQTRQDVADQFRTQSEQGTTRFDQGAVTSALDRPEEADQSAWDQYFNASYQGPTQLTGDLYNRYQGQTNQAASKAQASGSEAGRFALLDNYFGRPQYSHGEKSLDSFLVQSDQAAQPRLQQLQKQGQEGLVSAQQQSAELQNFGNQNRLITEDARAKTRAAIGVDDAGNRIEGQGALGSQQLAAQAQLDKILGQRTTDSGLLKTALESGDFTLLPEHLRELLKLGGINSFFGIDPKEFLNTVEEDQFTLASTATPEQLARMRALEKLAGLEGDWTQSEQGSTLDDESPFSFDSDTLKKQVDSKKAQYQDAVSNSAYKLSDDYSTANDSRGTELRGQLGTLLPQDKQPSFLGGEFKGVEQAIESLQLALDNAKAFYDKPRDQGGNPAAYKEAVDTIQPALEAAQKRFADIQTQYSANNTIKW